MHYGCCCWLLPLPELGRDWNQLLEKSKALGSDQLHVREEDQEEEGAVDGGSVEGVCAMKKRR